MALTNDGEIEASRHAGKLIAGPGEGRVQRQRFGRNFAAAARCGETLDRGFGGRFVVGLLPFDYVGGKVAAVATAS